MDRPPLGSVALSDIAAGEVILTRRLAPDGLSGPGALIPEGYRGVAVPTGPGTLPLAVGDIVDVLATVDPLLAEGEDPTSVVATDALVVDVGDESATIAVSARDAPALASALATGTVTLTLAGGV